MWCVVGTCKGKKTVALPETLERFEITNEAMLWDWLDHNHARDDGVALFTWKAAHRDKYVGRAAVLDALVAYGWIDGRRYVVDADRTAQLITPRRAQHWAKSYKDRAEALIQSGRMKAPGLATIERGKKSGLWDFMADVDALIVPHDLNLALGPDRSTWDGFAPSYRRNVLRWIKLAKSETTRSNRILETVKATIARQKIPQM